MCKDCQSLSMIKETTQGYYFYEYFCNYSGSAKVIFRRLEADEETEEFDFPTPDWCQKEVVDEKLD